MSEKPVKLGLMPPLTGLVGIYGTEITRAGQIACQEVNKNGGVLGRPLELVIEDDGSLPESAVAAASRLMDQHRCAAIIGNLLSNSRIAVAYRVAEPRKIPYLNFSFYEGSILSRYFFHFAALPNQQIDRMIPYMREKYGPRMFFAGNNYEWPRGSIDAAKRALRRAGGEVVGEEYCSIGVSDATIERLLDHLSETAPDVFVPYFAGADQVNLLTRFTQRGLKTRMAVVMGHYDEMMASKLPPEVRQGFYSSNTYFMTVDTPENRNYLARLATQPGVNGIWPQGNGILTNFGEGTHLCVKAFAEAANKAGSLDPEALVDALKTVRVSGPQGTVHMDPVTHHATVNTYLSRCGADGVFTIIEKFGAIAPVLPERYDHQRISHQATLEDDIRLQARMLENMSEAVLLVSSRDGSILYTNAGVDKMFGYDKGELLGKPIAVINDPKERDSHDTAAGIVRILMEKGEWQGEVRNVRKDGSSVWCAASVSTFTHPVHGEVWLSVHSDISARKQAEESLRNLNQELEQRVTDRTNALKQTSQMLQTVLDTAPFRIFWKDRELNYLGCNRVFAADAGKGSPRELIGKSDYDMAWKASADLYRQDDARVIATGQEKLAFEEPMDLPDGNRIWLSTSKVPLRDADGAVIGVLGTYQNITARKMTEQALVDTKNDAERANKAKSEFLSRMSHELRTPMNAILGFAQILDMDPLKPEQHEFVHEIQRAADHLLELINELLDLSRIEVGKMAIALQPVNVQSVVFDAVQITQPLISAKKIILINKCDADATVLADPTRLKQVLVNLLSNAAKYNRTGGRIVLDCHARDGDRLRFSVTDTGVGIPPEKLDSLYKPFERLGAEFSDIDGTGIGLALSKQLVELMDGTLGLDSTPEGTTFWIDLPQQVLTTHPAEAEILALEPAKSALPSLEGIKVLYVEDNPANLRLMQRIFANYPDITFIPATLAEAGLDLARQHKPDLILMDIHLPGMDGYEALAHLKNRKDTRHIPVIALSADAMPTDVERGLQAGFFRYLSKPINIKQLMETLDETLRLTR